MNTWLNVYFGVSKKLAGQFYVGLDYPYMHIEYILNRNTKALHELWLQLQKVQSWTLKITTLWYKGVWGKPLMLLTNRKTNFPLYFGQVRLVSGLVNYPFCLEIWICTCSLVLWQLKFKNSLWSASLISRRSRKPPLMSQFLSDSCNLTPFPQTNFLLSINTENYNYFLQNLYMTVMLDHGIVRWPASKNRFYYSSTRTCYDNRSHPDQQVSSCCVIWRGRANLGNEKRWNTHLRWCSPGTRGTGLWQSAAPNWTFPPLIPPVALA